MILHILTKAAQSTAAEQMQQVIGECDVVLLIEEGVTTVLSPEWTGWKQYSSRIFVLTEDTVARGLACIAEANAMPMLGMDEFVALTEQHQQTITWY